MKPNKSIHSHDALKNAPVESQWEREAKLQEQYHKQQSKSSRHLSIVPEPKKKSVIQGHIYVIECVRTNLKYIGVSRDSNKSLANHINCLKNGNHTCKPMQADWNEYGEHAFETKTLRSYDDLKEARRIKKLAVIRHADRLYNDHPDEEKRRRDVGRKNKPPISVKFKKQGGLK